MWTTLNEIKAPIMVAIPKIWVLKLAGTWLSAGFFAFSSIVVKMRFEYIVNTLPLVCWLNVVIADAMSVPRR